MNNIIYTILDGFEKLMVFIMYSLVVLALGSIAFMLLYALYLHPILSLALVGVVTLCYIVGRLVR